ncbi:MAG TPA: FAD-binding oxidoreductase [Burkholderiaceae bacterium]|nr:FAD-binding oxidoreductase [Burkholderiaceae bacterium]
MRPGDVRWPTPAQWQRLSAQVGDALIAVRSPWSACTAPSDEAACTAFFKSLKNPYFLGDEVGLTQTLGWVDAWTSRPSAYAVAARHARDVAAAVNFAREHDLRLVVKGGGHSYQGTSNAPDSLLVWTRRMNDIALHDAFVPHGCEAQAQPTRAVTVGAGAVWSQVYDAVTTRGGGYVQGGGCMTVGVAGLVSSGGFGSFSKAFGLAASSLLQAEVVTADGAVRVCNDCTHSDLFWALKGGGGGTFGVVTRLTLKVHELPETFGAVNFTVRAASDAAYRRLVATAVDLYASSLMNEHWGEQIRLRGNVLQVAMVFQGLTRAQASAAWQPFFDALDQSPDDYKIDFAPLKVVATSARTFFAPTLLKRVLGFIRRDERPGAPETNVFWPGDQGQAGQVLHGYSSTWLPAALLQPAQRPALVDALVAAARRWSLGLHFNKGLAGASPAVIAAARQTAINPAALDAFALVIMGAEEQPAYPNVAGHEPDVTSARQHRQAVAQAMSHLRGLVPEAGSYVSESDYFEADWQRSHWGANYARLAALKAAYDPNDLFIVHHGVGSERWSDDGFTRLA